MKRDDHKLVQRVLDGEIDREDFDRFQQRLRAEPELADLYTGYAVLNHTLSEEFEGGSSTLAAAGSGRGVFGIARITRQEGGAAGLFRVVAYPRGPRRFAPRCLGPVAQGKEQPFIVLIRSWARGF